MDEGQFIKPGPLSVLTLSPAKAGSFHFCRRDPGLTPGAIFCRRFAALVEKEIVLETIRELPHNCSIDEIAERIEFLAAVQKGSISSIKAKAILTKKLRSS